MARLKPRPFSTALAFAPSCAPGWQRLDRFIAFARGDAVDRWSLLPIIVFGVMILSPISVVLILLILFIVFAFRRQLHGDSLRRDRVPPGRALRGG